VIYPATNLHLNPHKSPLNHPFIVDLPNLKMGGSFHGYVSHNQMVTDYHNKHPAASFPLIFFASKTTIQKPPHLTTLATLAIADAGNAPARRAWGAPSVRIHPWGV